MPFGDINGQKSGVQSVAKKLPNPDGDVDLKPADIDALDLNGGEMKGPLTVQTATEPNEPVTKKSFEDGVNQSWKTLKGVLLKEYWSGPNYSLTVPDMTADLLVFVSPDASDEASLNKWRDSDIWCYKQDAGHLYFWAYGGKPNDNVNVNIAYRVGVKK